MSVHCLLDEPLVAFGLEQPCYFNSVDLHLSNFLFFYFKMEDVPWASASKRCIQTQYIDLIEEILFCVRFHLNESIFVLHEAFIDGSVVGLEQLA
jgi:hypothetical protein